MVKEVSALEDLAFSTLGDLAYNMLEFGENSIGRTTNNVINLVAPSGRAGEENLRIEDKAALAMGFITAAASCYAYPSNSLVDKACVGAASGLIGYMVTAVACRVLKLFPTQSN